MTSRFLPYSGYAFAASLYGIKYVGLEQDPESPVDMAGLIRQLTRGDLLFFCNPNNPTGRVYSRRAAVRKHEENQRLVQALAEVPMRLFLIRHGETVANSEKRYLGHTDSPLTTLGVRQAEELAERLLLYHPEAIFLSDLPRCLTTALPLIRRTGLPIHIDLRLRELDFGRIEGLTYTQAMNAYNSEMHAWYDDCEHKAPPRGETLVSMRARVFAFMGNLVGHPLKSAAIFTHGGVCNLLVAHALSLPFGDMWSHPGEMTEFWLTGTKDIWSLHKL